MDQEILARMSPENRAIVEEWQRKLKWEDSEEADRMAEELLARYRASQATLGKTTMSTSENPRD